MGVGLKVVCRLCVCVCSRSPENVGHGTRAIYPSSELGEGNKICHYFRNRSTMGHQELC